MQSLAIIGTGISGLSAAHFLKDHYDITLYEKEPRPGGHSNTILANENGTEIPIDTGFMVYNEVTYPLLTKLFKTLDVETKPTSMSFSVQHRAEDIEFNGASLNHLFGQRKNLLRPRFWKMLLQINRFNKETVAELAAPQYPDVTLADYVKARNYGADFLKLYLSPMAAAVWSSPPERIESFPAHTLMRFWHNHGFLGLDTQHPWRTVTGGSRKYVEKITAPFRETLHLETPVQSIDPQNRITLQDGRTRSHDKIIIAAHADQALALLQQPTPLEQEILQNFHYQANTAVLHTDPKHMPRTPRLWASWNYHISSNGKHSTHYWMNNLQHVSQNKNYFVSVNPPEPIPPEHHIKTIPYEHPVFDLPAIAAQTRIPGLHHHGHQTNRFFVGAWQRYGFHEDGIHSAHQLATHLLCEKFIF